MTITEALETILGARYGREVRQAIHDGIKQAYEDGTANGNANMEVSQARGSYPSLGQRLNEADNKQRQTTTEVNGLDQRIDNLVIPISPENANVEVTDAHNSIVKNKNFASIKDRFEEAESDLRSINQSIYKTFDTKDTIWTVGGLRGDTGQTNNTLTNSIYSNYMSAKDLIKIIPLTSITRFQVYFYTIDKVYINRTYETLGWLTKEYLFKHDGLFRILLAYTDNRTLTNDSLKNSFDISYNRDFTRYVSMEKYVADNIVWSKGTIDGATGATDDTYDHLIRSNFIKTKEETPLYIDCSSDTQFQVYFYDENYNYISRTYNDLGWLKSYVAKHTGYIRIILANVTTSIQSELDIMPLKITVTDTVESDNIAITTTLFDQPQSINNPRLVSHRGYQPEAPENSFPAFELAGQKGYWGAECDVRETVDGVFVVCHDSTIDRTYNGTGSVASMTYDQLQSYTIDVGNGVAGYTNEELKMPTLEEFLKICRKYGMIPMIEIKSIVNYESFIEIIKKYGFEKSCMVVSTGFSSLIETRKYNKNIYVHKVLSTISDLEGAINIKNCGLGFSARATEADIMTAHANDVKISCGAAETTEVAIDLINKGADFITTNQVYTLS